MNYSERKYWLHTVQINKRGLPIDLEAVAAIHDKLQQKMLCMNAEIADLTGGTVTAATQRQRILDFLNDNYDLGLENLQNITVESAVSDLPATSSARRILEIRRAANHPSTAKMGRILKQICKDITVKNNLAHCGCSTGRYAARGFQCQNLPRLQADYVEETIESFKLLNIESFELIHGDSMHAASGLIRSIIAAPYGYTLFNQDLSQIEARATAWVAREESILQAYRDGLDAYIVIAADMYQQTYENVTSKQREAGKIAVLACGYTGGWKALVGMGKNYKLDFAEKEARKIVNDFRKVRKKLVDSWYAFGDAARDAVLTPGIKSHVSTNRIFSFTMEGNYLFMQLPSGRRICFPFAEWKMWSTPWGENRMQVTAMWQNIYKGKKWERRALSGGSLLQSAVQGLCRDILVEAQLRLEERGYPIIMSVHDECTAIVPENDSRYSLDEFKRIFKQVPKWCRDLPINSSGWEGKRYRK
jgi:DNA polymerase